MGIALDGRLYDPRRLTWEQKQDRITDFVARSDRPVYFLGRAPDAVSDIDYGFYGEADRSKVGRTSFRVKDELLELFHRTQGRSELTDGWMVDHRNSIIARFARVLTAMVALGGPGERERYGADLELASAEFSGLLARIVFHQEQGGVSAERLLEWVAAAETLRSDSTRRTDHAILYLMQGRVLAALDRFDDAARAFERSVRIDGQPENKAFAELQALTAGRRPR